MCIFTRSKAYLHLQYCTVTLALFIQLMLVAISKIEEDDINKAIAELHATWQSEYLNLVDLRAEVDRLTGELARGAADSTSASNDEIKSLQSELQALDARWAEVDDEVTVLSHAHHSEERRLEGLAALVQSGQTRVDELMIKLEDTAAMIEKEEADEAALREELTRVEQLIDAQDDE